MPSVALRMVHSKPHLTTFWSNHTRKHTIHTSGAVFNVIGPGKCFPKPWPVFVDLQLRPVLIYQRDLLRRSHDTSTSFFLYKASQVSLFTNYRIEYLSFKLTRRTLSTHRIYTHILAGWILCIALFALYSVPAFPHFRPFIRSEFLWVV